MCIVRFKKFSCGHEYDDWFLCDDWLDEKLENFNTVNGEKQPDCETMIWNLPPIQYSHCYTLECCVSNVRYLQSKVRECEHRLALQAGVRLSIENVFDYTYGPHLREAQEDSFIAAWRHLNLCATVVRLGTSGTQGIVTHTRTHLKNRPYKDIRPENQALQIFHQFSYEFKEARRRARLVYGENYIIEIASHSVLLESTAADYNGLGQVLWFMIHLASPQEVLFQRPNFPPAPDLSPEQKRIVSELISQQTLDDKDWGNIDAVLAARIIHQPSMEFTAQWIENEENMGKESRVAFHQRLQGYLIEDEWEDEF